MYSIESDLSVSGMDNLLKELQDIKKRIPVLNKKFLDLSLKWLEERAQFHIRETVGKTGYIPTGTLESSFIQEFEGNTGKLTNNATDGKITYAVFVEYGTGAVGKANSHENATEIGYSYDINNHGENGWWYYDVHGEIHWTKGMAAHRFMYNALMDYLQFGKDECAKEVFKE